MQCPECNTENPDQARFCMNCAAPLVLVCPECGTELPPTARFCFNCSAPVEGRGAAEGESRLAILDEAMHRLVPKEFAERLLATRGQVSRERRIVTILFSDVKGSTVMAEELDPEDWADIMDGAFDVLIEPVYRYEGTLARLMGDAILAFFGAPIAHEDDPERACRAALEIIEGAQRYAQRLEEERGISGFAVRVGINTGLVVVGEVGSDLRVEYTAMGDAINLAARMESAAEPGTVLISEDTHKLIAPLFETEALGAVQVKGKAEPVSVFRVVAAKDVPGKGRGIAGLESPLVGREAESAALLEAVQRLQAGVGGIVTIVGEPGIGKSRLVAEVCKTMGATAPSVRGCAAEGLSIRWVEGRCLSYGTSIAYSLWLDVLRGLLGIAVDAAPEAAAEALQHCVRTWCAEHYDNVYPYVARLMSLEDEPLTGIQQVEGEQLKQATFLALQRLIEGATRSLPLAVVCEDLQWADPTSIELLERTLALTDRASLLLICVFRPDKEHGSWRIKEIAARDYEHRHTDLSLRALSSTESEALVSNLLQIGATGQELTQRILSVAEGNPLFVEEVIRALVDQGVVVPEEATGRWLVTQAAADVALPDTLQAVLLARIDRLQEETKRVLQMASVIGRIFLYRVLQAIAEEERELDAHLLALQRQQMIRERARIPEREYIFKHHLTQEAAYNGLLRKERRTFHRQVAEALERLFPTRIEEQVELLAHHWERAGVNDKAVAYLIRAGDRARRNYACTEALQHYTLGLELAEKASLTDATLASIHEKRGRAYASIANMSAARQDLQCVLQWSRLTGDQRKEAETLLDMIEPLLTGHEVGAAFECAQTAHVIATTLEDRLLIARSTGAIGAALCVQGDLSEAHDYLQAALDAARAHGADDVLAETLLWCMQEREWIGDFRGALAIGDEALALAEKMRNPSMVLTVYHVVALSRCGLGEYEAALRVFAEADELAEKTEVAVKPVEFLNSKGWVYQEVYDLEQSVRLNREGMEVAREQGEVESEANALVNLGVDHLWLGELEQAEQCFVEAWGLLEKQFGGYRWRWKTRLLAAWGELYLARGEADRALDYAEQCLQLAERTSARKNLVKGWKLKGEALAAVDRVEEATCYLEKAISVAEEIGNPPLAWKSRYALAQILEQVGRDEEAQQHYTQAAASIKQTAASLSDLGMRETFLSAGPVRAVLDAKG